MWCGYFLKCSDKYFSNCLIYGIEIDKNKLDNIDDSDGNLKLFNSDIFNFNFDKFDKNKSFLIIGNPPCVTNKELSKMNSTNIPHKSNFKKFSGLIL